MSRTDVIRRLAAAGRRQGDPRRISLDEAYVTTYVTHLTTLGISVCLRCRDIGTGETLTSTRQIAWTELDQAREDPIEAAEEFLAREMRQAINRVRDARLKS